LRGLLEPGDYTNFRFAFMDYTEKFPEGTETTVTPIGAILGASRPGVTRAPEMPRSPGRDPNLKGKIRGY